MKMIDKAARWAFFGVRVALGLVAAGCSSDCSTDTDCGAGEFCDRSGTCENAVGRFAYGTECDEALFNGMDRDLNFCGGYLCLESRCRSCQTDAECIDVHGAPACRSFDGMPGLACGALPIAE